MVSAAKILSHTFGEILILIIRAPCRIYKPKYADDGAEKGSGDRRGRDKGKADGTPEKKGRDKSRTRTIFGRRKSISKH